MNKNGVLNKYETVWTNNSQKKSINKLGMPFLYLHKIEFLIILNELIIHRITAQISWKHACGHGTAFVCSFATIQRGIQVFSCEEGLFSFAFYLLQISGYRKNEPLHCDKSV